MSVFTKLYTPLGRTSGLFYINCALKHRKLQDVSLPTLTAEMKCLKHKYWLIFWAVIDLMYTWLPPECPWARLYTPDHHTRWNANVVWNFMYLFFRNYSQIAREWSFGMFSSRAYDPDICFLPHITDSRRKIIGERVIGSASCVIFVFTPSLWFTCADPYCLWETVKEKKQQKKTKPKIKIWNPTEKKQSNETLAFTFPRRLLGNKRKVPDFHSDRKPAVLRAALCLCSTVMGGAGGGGPDLAMVAGILGYFLHWPETTLRITLSFYSPVWAAALDFWWKWKFGKGFPDTPPYLSSIAGEDKNIISRLFIYDLCLEYNARNSLSQLT